MKSFILFIIIGLTVINQTVHAQQEPNFTQYIYETRFFNPAQVKEGFVGLDYRQQWTDLDEGAPTSYFVIADFSSLLKLQDNNIGLGLKFTGDETHVLQRNDIGLSFAYHLINTDNQELSAGMNAGVLFQRFDFNDRRINDPFDIELLNGQQNQSAFNGGFGLSYHLNPDNPHHIFVDVSAPQLFSSELSYDSGVIWDLVPHLMARVSYRYESSMFGVEPIILYRNFVGDQELKAGNLDLGLRFLLLNNKLWLGGGARLDAETFHISFGANVYQGLQILGSFGNNTLFGNSIELGLLYDFKPSVPPFAREIKQMLEAMEAVNEESRLVFIEIDQGIESLNNNTYPEIALKERIEFLEKKIKKLKPNGQRLKTYNINVESKYREALNQKDKIDDKSLEKINTIKTEANDITRRHDQRLLNVSRKVRELRSALLPNIDELFRNKNLVEITRFYEKKLDKVIGKPVLLDPVNSIQNSNENIVVTYGFTKNVDAYDLSSNELRDVKILADHIVDNITTLKQKGLTIKNIELYANLRESYRRWRFKSGTYNGELGNKLNIEYKIQEANNPLRAGTNGTISKGDLSMEQANALKLFAMKQYFSVELRKSGVQPIVNLELNGPNEQSALQVYKISIIVE